MTENIDEFVSHVQSILSKCNTEIDITLTDKDIIRETIGNEEGITHVREELTEFFSNTDNLTIGNISKFKEIGLEIYINPIESDHDHSNPDINYLISAVYKGVVGMILLKISKSKLFK